MIERIAFLRAERLDVLRQLSDCAVRAREAHIGAAAAERRIPELESRIARLDDCIAQWEAAAARVL